MISSIWLRNSVTGFPIGTFPVSPNTLSLPKDVTTRITASMVTLPGFLAAKTPFESMSPSARIVYRKRCICSHVTYIRDGPTCHHPQRHLLADMQRGAVVFLLQGVVCFVKYPDASYRCWPSSWNRCGWRRGEEAYDKQHRHEQQIRQYLQS